MKSCPSEEVLAARIDGALAPAEARAVDAHAAGCATCADVLAGQTMLDAALRGLEAEAPPEPLPARLRVRLEGLLAERSAGASRPAAAPKRSRRARPAPPARRAFPAWLPIGAAVAAAAALFLLVVLPRLGPGKPRPDAARTPAGPKAQPEKPGQPDPRRPGDHPRPHDDRRPDPLPEGEGVPRPVPVPAPRPAPAPEPSGTAVAEGPRPTPETPGPRPSPGPPSGTAPRVEDARPVAVVFVAGAPRVRREGTTEPLTAGDRLAAAIVEASGRDPAWLGFGSSAVALAKGTVVGVGASPDGGVSLALERGSVLAEAATEAGEASPFAVETAQATIAGASRRFLVSVEAGRTQVAVDEGAVSVRPRGAREAIEVRAGLFLTVRADERPSAPRPAEFGKLAAWADEVRPEAVKPLAPPPALEWPGPYLLWRALDPVRPRLAEAGADGALAALVAGARPDDPAVVAGLAAAREAPSAETVLLVAALAARGTKPSPEDVRLVRAAAETLLAKPAPLSSADLLALKVARRLGAKVPASPFVEAARTALRARAAGGTEDAGALAPALATLALARGEIEGEGAAALEIAVRDTTAALEKALATAPARDVDALVEVERAAALSGQAPFRDAALAAGGAAVVGSIAADPVAAARAARALGHGTRLVLGLAPVPSAATGVVVRPLSRALDRFEVTFVYRPPAGAPGRTVALTGDFNGWDKAGAPMVRQRDGTFRATIELPRGRTEYKFILDQNPKWEHDPVNPLSRADGYGGFNSILDL